jgi:hypothetical protein
MTPLLNTGEALALNARFDPDKPGARLDQARVGNAAARLEEQQTKAGLDRPGAHRLPADQAARRDDNEVPGGHVGEIYSHTPGALTATFYDLLDRKSA